MMKMEKEIIELPPMCFLNGCEEFRYKKGAEELYRCKIQCMKSNDLFEIWEGCPFIEKKYLVREYEEEGDGDEREA